LVALSSLADETSVVQALREGATAYLLATASKEELLAGIRAAAQNRRYLSPPLSPAAIEARLDASVPADHALAALTPREREVFLLAAEGLSSVEIAHRLRVSPRTIDAHRANVIRKLGLKNRTELVRYALTRGLLASWPVRADEERSRASP
jgi:DNA-binding NarL/FixJ family response regulator